MKDKTQELMQKAEEVAREELEEGRFDGTIEVQEFAGEPCIVGGIDTQTMRKINIKFNPNYERENKGKLADVVRDVARHEINHKTYYGFNGCPRNLDNHVELITEPIAEILKRKGYGAGDIHYIANALEDTILHNDLNRRFSLDGINCFFADVGRHNDNKFTDFYEAHAKLNLFLWGNKKQKKELAKYFNHSKKVTEVLKNFLKKIETDDFRQKIGNSETEIKNREGIRNFFNDESNWPRISRAYAEEFSKLMQPGYSMPLFNHSGEGTKGHKDKGQKTETGEPEENKETKEPSEGNSFDKEMYRPEFKKKRMQKAYEKGEGIPAWLNSFEALDLLYQSLAQRLNIKVETFTKQSSMPIYHYGKRAFDPDKDNLKHTAFGFDDKGKIELKKKRWHENMPLEYKVNPKGFPEVRFCLLDTSGSMQESPNGRDNAGESGIIPWGDNSKYHYALLGWYGLLEYLKQNHLLKQANVSLGNFSNRTYVGEGLTEAKQVALKPQFGNTLIDLNKIKKMFKSNGMLIFTISDGEIANWGDIREDFIKEAKKHYYFHLQIGSHNETTRDLKNAGLYVERITSAKDLATKVIDLTDKLYRGNKQ